MAPVLEIVDHVHVYVADRARAEIWYRDVLDLRRDKVLEVWADGGPLMLGSRSGSVKLALFERERAPCRSTIAFRVDAAGFKDWLARLDRLLDCATKISDHALAWSMYFDDPFGNPFEITCYDYNALASGLIGRRSSGS
ncbi:VOC family protein [Lichenicoccus sp.]|uniref:VOC family protein n=1 Tax=Lichenicoccus sp. TaxID=2781899 RepID=UPI003D0D9D9E